MKNSALFLIGILLIIALAGCGKSASKDEKPADTAIEADTTDTSASPAEPDVDISRVGTSIIYTKATEIAGDYKSYLGQTIKIKGNFKAEKSPDRYYFYCLVKDPTACCNAGFEFILKDTAKQYPDDYPADDAEFVVQGKLHSYMEGDKTYLELIDATILS